MKNSKIMVYISLLVLFCSNGMAIKIDNNFILKFKECEVSIPNKFVLLSSFKQKQGYKLIYNPPLLDLNSSYEVIRISEKNSNKNILDNKKLKIDGMKIIENCTIKGIHKIRAKGVVNDLNIDINFLIIGDKIVIETFNVKQDDISNILNHCLETKK